MKKRLISLVPASFMAVLLVLAGCTSAPSPAAYTINVASAPSLGQVLVDGNGMTLYWTTADTAGVSNVPDNLLSVWPVFYVSVVTVPSSLNAGDFTTIVRSDGTPQTAYKGFPLYYYASDTAPGQTGGQGLGGKWSAVSPSASGPQPVATPTPTPTPTTTPSTTPATTPAAHYTIDLGSTPALGEFLVDGSRMTLYWTTADSAGVSNVPDSLLNVWPVFYVAAVNVPASLNAGDFSTIQRSDGTSQTAYKGYPLYYYGGDPVPGQTGGQGLGGKWSVVNPDASGPQPVTAPTS